MKRLFDFTAALVGLVVVSPVMLVIAVLVRASIGSPVFFRQQRPGLRGISFQLVKFRTMRELDGAHNQPLPDAQRLTRLGKFLRASSLDELPELWNVLRGEMSLVGPRPLLMQYLPLYTATQARRHEVRPGITGWAQICGRNVISWDDKFALDVWYVDHHSFGLDLRILATTVVRVVRREGIVQQGHATVQPFEGSGGK